MGFCEETVSPADNSGRSTIFLAGSALLLGAFIYIFLRPSESLFFNWMHAIGLDRWLKYLRLHSLSQIPQVPTWIVYSLPNGLWAFAYALLIKNIWSGSKSWFNYFWTASIPVLVLGFEILQYAGIIHGTFSLQDIAFSLAGLTLGIFAGIKISKRKHHEKTKG
ncbi:MAG: hypothetical protein V2B15_18015 [Bacteroidota bacterium]